MVMSHGTYTFLACFAGFWLVWAAIVMLCCFCSFLQRRLKRRREERLREQCPRPAGADPLSCGPAYFAPTGPPQFLPVFPPLFVTFALLPPSDTDVVGKPPCYEEAVLMEDPPPPYSEVLADPRGGTYLKPAPPRVTAPPLRENRDSAEAFTPSTCKHSRWDSLGHLLSNMDLNHNNLTPPRARSVQAGPPGGPAEPQGVHTLRGLEAGGGMPTAFPLLGRSTAV
uniref:Proline-rich protein 7 n=1 Tax=Oryzias sinensis TaxID=183150 RepID=A0A8C8DLV5_9TELE